MANQDNFKSDIQELSSEVTRFNVSRVFDNMLDPLLEMEVPVEFDTTDEKNTIELSLYSLADNSLIYFDVIRGGSDQTIMFETYQYIDNTVRKLVFIDFSKFSNVAIPSGRFTVSLNFFRDELGSNDSKPLSVRRVSPSRKEVEFTFDEDFLEDVNNFLDYRIPNSIVYEVVAQLCNQTNSETYEIPAINNTTDQTAIAAATPPVLVNLIDRAEFDQDRIGSNNESVYTVAQDILDEVHTLLVDIIEKEIEDGKTFFYAQYLLDLIAETIGDIYSRKKLNPYRFTLV
jgi:hypothetical protein